MSKFWCFLCGIREVDNEIYDIPITAQPQYNLISQKLQHFQNADVPNLSRLILSFLDFKDYFDIAYHQNIPELADILYNGEKYVSANGVINYTGILMYNLEYKCRRHRNRIIIPRGIFIPRAYFDRNGDLIINAYDNFIFPKNRVAVMATVIQVTPAIVLKQMIMRSHTRFHAR